MLSLKSSLENKFFEGDLIKGVDVINAININDKGIILFNKGFYKKAVELFSTALEINNESITLKGMILHNLSLAYRKQGANCLADYYHKKAELLLPELINLIKELNKDY